VSVQLLGPDGAPIAQSDRQPTTRDGALRPTIGWIPGEIIRDHHEITIPPDVALGQVEVGVTVYRAESGVRLPARSRAGASIRIDDDLARVGRLRITGR
jgi:hypothetical protein